MNGYQICTQALIDARILGDGESPSDSMVSNAQTKANQMLSSWSAQMTPIWSKVTNEYPLIPGKREYKIGSTGDFVQARPLQITSCQLKLWNNFDYSVKVTSWDDYQYTLFKDLKGFPINIGVNPTIPNMTVDFYPVPITNCTIRITSLIAMDSMTLGAEYEFPPGYEAAVIANLVIWLRNKYGLPNDPFLMEQAQSTKQIIDSANFNSQIGEMSPDFSAPGYSQVSGQWQYLWGWGFLGDNNVSNNPVIPLWVPGGGAETTEPIGSYKIGQLARGSDGGNYISLIPFNLINPVVVTDPPVWQSFAMNG